MIHARKSLVFLATAALLAAGAVAHAQTQNDFDQCNREAQAAAGGAVAAPGSNPSASPGAGKDSAAYQQAYRDCLKRRGF